MFNNITLSEEEFKDILNGSYNHSVNDYNFNIFNKRNSDIWKNIKTFEIGFIVDEISEYFHLSKTIEHFVKNFVFQNGFLRFKKINNCEYIEIVCLFDNNLISNLKDKLLLSGFNFLYQEKYCEKFLFLSFRRGKEEKIENIFYIEDRGHQPKIKREGVLFETKDNLVINKKTFYYNIPDSEELKKYKNNCFGFNIYKIDFSKIKNPSFCTSFEDNNKLYVLNDIPKENISIERVCKNYV